MRGVRSPFRVMASPGLWAFFTTVRGRDLQRPRRSVCTDTLPLVGLIACGRPHQGQLLLQSQGAHCGKYRPDAANGCWHLRLKGERATVAPRYCPFGAARPGTSPKAT